MLKDRSRSQTAPQEGEDTDNLLEENDYNPFATPPDLAKALKHQKATKIGKFDMNQTEKVEICECCNTPTNHKPLPVCGSRLELSSLGAGFPLYFEYVFHCGILLLLLFVTVGIPGLSSNPKGTQCALYKNAARDPCQGGFVINYSLVNMNSRDDWVLGSGLSFLFVFVCMPLVAYCRVAQSKTAEKVDSGVVASSDYTVMVSKIPATETAEQIKAFFEKHGSQSRVASNVKNVNMAYHIGTYVGLVRKKKELEEKIAKGNAPQRVKSQLKAVEKRLEKFEKAVDNNSSTQFTGIAFVTFNTEREAAEVVKKFTLTRLQKLWYACCCCFGCGEDKTYNGEYIKVRKAPDPMDVFWENLGYDWWKTMRIRILSFISALILVAMSFGMILGISIWQEQVKKDSASNTSLITFLAFLSSYLVTIINVLIGIFMRKLAGLEKHTTWTYYFVSVGKKLTYAQFFNTALLNVLVQLFKTERFNLWVEGSLVSKVFFLFLLNSFVPSVSYLFNPEFILRLFKRRKMASEGEKSKLNQQQANLLFEGPPVDLAQRYANIQKTLLFTGFYARLVPIGIVFSFAGLILAYWTDKYLLLRRHSRPRALGKELAEDMSNFMQHFIIAFASGSLVFEIITIGYASGFSIVALVFAVLFYLLPDGCCLACCRRSRGVSNHKTYDEARLNFLTDYDRANPVTQEEATRDWIMEISQVYDGKDEKGQNPQNVAAYLQQVPRQTQFVSLANYAQNNLSFRQMHQMNGNSNFNMSFIPRPQQVMLVRQVNPALMNRPGFTPMQLMGPQRIAVPVRLIPQQLQAFYPRVMPNGFIPNLPPRPIIPNHVPQQSPQHVSVDIPKQKPEVAKHLPQQTAPVVQPIFMNQSPQPQHSPASISPLPGNMIQPPTVLVRPPVQMQPQPYPMNQPMMPMNQAPVMQYPGMMPPRNIPVQQVQMMPFGGQPQPGQYGFQPPPQQQFGMQQNMVAPQFGMQQPMMPMQYPMGGQPGFGTNQRF